MAVIIPTREAEHLSEPVPAIQNPDVLVVDQDLTTEQTVQAALGSAARIRAVASGYQALYELEMQPPDVLVLDMILPGLNGLELLHRVQAAGKRVPVIIVSHTQSQQLDVDELEVVAVVHKPLAVELLRAALSNALGYDVPTDTAPDAHTDILDPSRLARPMMNCPACQSTNLVFTVEDTTQAVHFLCDDCSRCWHVSSGYVHRFHPPECTGCAARQRCEDVYADDLAAIGNRFDAGRQLSFRPA